MSECMKVGHSYNEDCAECLRLENIRLKDSYRLVSSVEAKTEIENVKLKTDNKELKRLKTVSVDLVDALIISKLEVKNNKLIAALEVYANKKNWIESDRHINFTAYKVAEKAINANDT